MMDAMLLLERCRRANQDIEQLADRLMMMRDSQIHISQVLDGMPPFAKFRLLPSGASPDRRA